MSNKTRNETESVPSDGFQVAADAMPVATVPPESATMSIEQAVAICQLWAAGITERTPENEATVKKARAIVAKSEDKGDRFRRLANPRLNRAEKDILALVPLANQSSYHYTPDQVQEMLSVLTAAVNTVRSAFQRPVKVAQCNRL